MCLLALVLTSGCHQQPPAPKAIPHVVRYQLDWTLDDLVRAADGASWEITNNLGYRVRVTRGYVTSYSMELVECPRDVPATPVAMLRTFFASIIEGTAYAGHSTGTPNPAAMRAMRVCSRPRSRRTRRAPAPRPGACGVLRQAQ